MNSIEYLGAITGFLCVWLATRRHVLNWPFAIVSSLCYIVVFYQVKLYVDTALQFFFIGSSIYGWFYWKSTTDEKTIEAVKIQSKTLASYILIMSLLAFLLGWWLKKNTDASLPFFDAFTGCFSVLAQWLLARKHIENWIIWIAVDILYVGMYISRELYPTAILFFAFLILALMGYYGWKKPAFPKHLSNES